VGLAPLIAEGLEIPGAHLVTDEAGVHLVVTVTRRLSWHDDRSRDGAWIFGTVVRPGAEDRHLRLAPDGHTVVANRS
jgi:hypothetical protein